MDMVKRLLAIFLVATAVATALNLILTPVYHNGSAAYPVWEILNWFLAAAVLVSLVVSILRRLALRSEKASTLEYVRTSMTFYGAIALTMLFFWEWFWTLNPSSETGESCNLAHSVLPALGHALRSRHSRHRPISLERRW